MEKIAWDGPKWGREGLFRANTNLADILGDTGFDFENFHFGDFLDPEFLDFQVPRFPEIWPGPSFLRPVVANWPEEPSGPKNVDFLL